MEAVFPCLGEVFLQLWYIRGPASTKLRPQKEGVEFSLKRAAVPKASSFISNDWRTQRHSDTTPLAPVKSHFNSVIFYGIVWVPCHNYATVFCLLAQFS